MESFDEPKAARNACTCRFRIYRHDPFLSVTLRVPRPSSLSVVCESSHGYLAPELQSFSRDILPAPDGFLRFGIQPSTQPIRTRLSSTNGLANTDLRFPPGKLVKWALVEVPDALPPDEHALGSI